MGDNIQYIETFSIEGDNPSILGLQNEHFTHLDLKGTTSNSQPQLTKIPYNLLTEVGTTLEVLILSHNHFNRIGNRGDVYSSLGSESNENVFPRMETLISLELDACYINSIEKHAFDGFPQLKHLSLKHFCS